MRRFTDEIQIKLGTISGIEIGLHYSWFIIAALIVFSLGEHFRQVNPSWSPAEIWIAALFTAVLFFVTLLLHELSHSLVAQARGLKVKAITLFALGGVSQIEEDATDAKTEFWVAIAGPVGQLDHWIRLYRSRGRSGLASSGRAPYGDDRGARLAGIYQRWARDLQFDSRVSARWWPRVSRHRVGDYEECRPLHPHRGARWSSRRLSFHSRWVMEFLSAVPALTAFGPPSSVGS